MPATCRCQGAIAAVETRLAGIGLGLLASSHDYGHVKATSARHAQLGSNGMNERTLAGVQGRSSQLAQAMLWFGVASTIGLFLILCLFLAARRFGGAFDQPLNAPALLLLGIGVAALAACLRSAWPRSRQTFASVSSWFRLLLPSVVVFLFCYALSLPGSAAWSVALLWFLVVIAEGVWWLSELLVLQTVRRRTSNTIRSSLVSASPADQTRQDMANQVGSDVTQQMTRTRSAAGGDLVFGQARADFTVGARSQIVHLAFCPPLAGSPRITVKQAGGPQAAITVAQGESFGARFDIRLASTARQPESVMIEYEARFVAAGKPSNANDDDAL